MKKDIFTNSEFSSPNVCINEQAAPFCRYNYKQEPLEPLEPNRFCFLTKNPQLQGEGQLYTSDYEPLCPPEFYIVNYTYPLNINCFLTSDFGQLNTIRSYEFCPSPRHNRPLISLIGTNVDLIEGELYIEQGATASGDGGDLTEQIIIKSYIVNEPGMYSVKYYVKDCHGLEDERIRIVTIS